MIPDTWESARYIYVPIRDLKGGIWGVCGFEITDLYFQLTHKTEETQLGNIIYALLDNTSGKYTGQFSSNRYNTNSQTDNILKLTEKKKLCVFDFGNDTCIGKTNTHNYKLNRKLFRQKGPELKEKQGLRIQL